MQKPIRKTKQDTKTVLIITFKICKRYDHDKKQDKDKDNDKTRRKDNDKTEKKARRNKTKTNTIKRLAK